MTIFILAHTLNSTRLTTGFVGCDLAKENMPLGQTLALNIATKLVYLHQPVSLLVTWDPLPKNHSPCHHLIFSGANHIPSVNTSKSLGLARALVTPALNQRRQEGSAGQPIWDVWFIDLLVEVLASIN